MTQSEEVFHRYCAQVYAALILSEVRAHGVPIGPASPYESRDLEAMADIAIEAAEVITRRVAAR